MGRAFFGLLAFVLVCEQLGLNFGVTIVLVLIMMLGLAGSATNNGSNRKQQGKRR